MKEQQEKPLEGMFLDMPSAARIYGISLRHFRRIADENNLRIMQIGRKFFVLRPVLEAFISKMKSPK